MRARTQVPAEVSDVGARAPWCPIRAATQNCAHVLARALGVATCDRGHRRGWAEPGSTPKRARGQGRPPRGLWRDVVGAMLVLAGAALMGEAPGSGRGWNKEEKSEGRRTAEEEEEEEAPRNAEGPGE